MGSVEAAGQLRQAIESLYGGGHSRPDVNQWLVEFSASPAAWEAAFLLLDPSTTPDIRFFCANLLLNKVKNEWAKLSSEQRQQLPALISQRLQALLPSGELLALLRLCIVLATIAVYTGGEQASAFLSDSLQLSASSAQSGQVMLRCGLQMLTTFAEEAEPLDRARRQQAVEACLKHQRAVLSLIESVLTLQLQPPGSSPPPLAPALICLHAWLKLDPQAAARPALSPGQLRGSFPGLFSVLLSLLVADALDVTETAAEVAGHLLGPGMVGDDGGAADVAAVEAALRVLLTHKDWLSSPSESPGAVAVARVAASIATRDPEMLCQSAQLAGPVAEMMVGGAAGGSRKVAESAVEYFGALNVVPVSERLVPLREEAFAALVQALLRHVSYPEEFTSWDDSLLTLEDDEDSFADFREQVAAEGLAVAYPLMGSKYLAMVLQLLQGAATWQAAEAALFYLLSVADAARGRALSKPSPAAPAAEAQEQASTASALNQMFALLCTPSPCSRHLANPYALQTAARLIGIYSAYLASEHSAGRSPPLEGALRLLLSAMPLRPCSAAASQSFRSLCARCTAALAPAAVLYPLMDAAMAVVAPEPPAGQVAAVVHMEPSERGLVVEGLARIVAQADPGAAVEAGLKLLRPFILRAQSVSAAGGAVGELQLALVADEMKMVAAAMKHMDFPPEGPGAGGLGHPAVRLLEGAWPLMTSLAQSPVCRGTPAIVEALCQVYQRFLMSAKGAAKPVLRLLITSLLDVFAAAPQPPVLAALGTVTELFGQVLSDPEVAALQEQALGSTVATTFALIQSSGASLAQHGDLLGAQLALAKRYLTFSRPLLAASPALPPLFRAAASALALRDREPLAPALALLSQLLGSCTEAALSGGDEEYNALGRRVQESMSQSGQEVVAGVVGALTDTCPRPLWRQLASVLHPLLAPSSCRAAAVGWLQGALLAPTLPVVQANMVSMQDCQRFLGLLLRQPPLPRGKFDMLVADFAGMCRGEAGADALLAYEM